MNVYTLFCYFTKEKIRKLKKLADYLAFKRANWDSDSGLLESTTQVTAAAAFFFFFFLIKVLPTLCYFKRITKKLLKMTCSIEEKFLKKKREERLIPHFLEGEQSPASREFYASTPQFLFHRQANDKKKPKLQMKTLKTN